MGAVSAGAKIETEFEIRNSSKDEVRIAAIKASCACTRALPREFPIVIAPESSYFLPVSFQAGSDPVVKTEELVVSFEDEEIASLLLTVSVDVKQALRVFPEIVDFNVRDSPDDPPGTKRVFIRGIEPGFSLFGAQSPSGDVRIVEVSELDPSEALWVLILQCDDLSKPRQRTSIYVDTNDEFNPKIRIPVVLPGGGE